MYALLSFTHFLDYSFTFLLSFYLERERERTYKGHIYNIVDVRVAVYTFLIAVHILIGSN